jgi:hypothetical protein
LGVVEYLDKVKRFVRAEVMYGLLEFEKLIDVTIYFEKTELTTYIQVSGYGSMVIQYFLLETSFSDLVISGKSFR